MRLFRTFSVYTVLGVLHAGVSFLVLPILTRYLTPADYGIIALVNTYVSLLMPIVGMSSSALVSLEYHNKKLDKPDYAKLVTASLVIPFFAIIFLGVVAVPFYNSLPGLLEIPLTAILLIFPLTFLVLVSESYKAFLVTANKVKAFSVVSVGRIFIEIALTLIFIVVLGLNWEGRIYSWLIFVFLVSLFAFYYFQTRGYLNFRISRADIYKVILFGSPLILHEIGKFVIDQSDRLFLAKMVSVSEMGIYSVGYQVAMVLLIIVTAFTNFLTPFLLERLNNITDYKKIEIVRVCWTFLLGLLGSLVLLALLTPWLFSVFIGKNFQSGTLYVFWVGLGFFFWGIYLVFSGYIFFLKKNYILALLAIVNVVLNITFNYIFIRSFGAIGAAYATCLSYFIVALIISIWCNRLYPMPWFNFKAILSRNEKII